MQSRFNFPVLQTVENGHKKQIQGIVLVRLGRTQNILFVSSATTTDMHDDTSDNAHDIPHAKFSDVMKCCQNGDMKRALYLIDDHIKQDPHDDNAYMIKMQILESMKRWNEIIECVDHMTGMSEFGVMILKAKMYGHMNDLKQARAHMDMAERAEGGPTARMCDAKAEILGTISAAGHPEVIDEAIRCAEKACNLDDKNGTYHSTAAAVLFAKQANAGHMESNLDILKRSFKHGKKALMCGDTDASTYYNLGRVLFAVQKFSKSLKYFKLAYKADPDHIKSRGMAGAAIAYQNDKTPKQYRSAIIHMEYVLQRDPSCTFLYKAMGNAYLKINNMATGTSYLEMATKIEPDDFLSWMTLVVAYITSGNMKDAKRCHKIATALNPDMISMDELLESHKALSDR